MSHSGEGGTKEKQNLAERADNDGESASMRSDSFLQADRPATVALRGSGILSGNTLFGGLVIRQPPAG